MKILIADDHAVVRTGLIQIISEIPEVSSLDEAEDGEQVIVLVNQNKYDLIILDISMPKRSGLEVLTHLRKTFPKLPILVLSVYPENQYAKRVIQAGASGFIAKHSEPNELKEAILKTVNGGKYISKELAEHLAFELFEPRKENIHEILSLREFEVMRLIASGKSVSQIADEIFLSVKTISTYRSRIIQKTKLKNNAEITRYCIINKLV
ncbi:MAG: response regulator transcription factor [Melioribacteraceae bacterium]|nr:response regulator transcription factor [Melioribacteraceae bacterium]